MSYLRLAKEAEARLRAAKSTTEGNAVNAVNAVNPPPPGMERMKGLDWRNAVSLCLLCGWYGLRDDFPGHPCAGDIMVVL